MSSNKRKARTDTASEKVKTAIASDSNEDKKKTGEISNEENSKNSTEIQENASKMEIKSSKKRTKVLKDTSSKKQKQVEDNSTNSTETQESASKMEVESFKKGTKVLKDSSSKKQEQIETKSEDTSSKEESQDEAQETDENQQRFEEKPDQQKKSKTTRRKHEKENLPEDNSSDVKKKAVTTKKQAKEQSGGTDPKPSTSKEEPKGPKPPNRSILQLKITLRDVTPPIWRRIQVLNNATFYDLHSHIKEAMGWMSAAHHHFMAPDMKKKDKMVFIGDQNYDFEKTGGPKMQSTKLSKFLNYKGDWAMYEFSADSWQHDIVVEKVLPPPGPKAEYPKCTGGQRACPPEDCGGVDGFQHLLEVYKNPEHAEYEELIQNWLADENPGWDPDKFDKKKIFKRVRMWVYCGP